MGNLLPGCGASGVGRSPMPDRPSLGRAAGARHPLAEGAGGVGVETHHLPHSARSCERAVRAVGAAGGRSRQAPLASVWGVRGWALSQARPPVLGACGQGRLRGCAGVGAQLSVAAVVSRARFPGLRQVVAIVAWHLSSCRGCGGRRAFLPCLVAPRWCPVPRPVRSLSALQ